MSFVRWNDEGRSPIYSQIMGIWGVLFGLFYFFGGLRFIGSIWAPHDDQSSVWWPRGGMASMLAVLVALFSGCLLIFLQKRLTNPEPFNRAVVAVTVFGCLSALGYDSFARVEVRGDNLVLRSPAQVGLQLSPDDIERFEVGCLLGRRSSPEPALLIIARDGEEIDLGDMFAVAWNGPPKDEWLAAAEALSASARRRGVWAMSMHPSGRSNVYLPCVSRFAERFPTRDRSRVEALFKPN